MNKQRVSVICWGKASDVALIESLQDHFPSLTVVIYKIPPRYWISWVTHRIKYIGLFNFFGHLLLSVWIRLERTVERLRRQNVWIKTGTRPPSWKNLQAKPVLALSEAALIEAVRGSGLILFTDNIRLSHAFYRKNKTRVLQCVWGSAPDFMGDSGGFWAYALGDVNKCGPTLIERGSQYDSFSVIKQLTTPLSKQETLRTIKVKQVAKMSGELASLLGESNLSNRETVSCRTFYAPTMFTYLRFLTNGHSLTKIPKYAHKKHTCTVAV